MNRSASARQGEMLRTENQHVIAAYGFDGGTFPHIAEILEPRHIQLTGELPALRRQGGTGIGAFVVIFRIGSDTDAHVFPVDQILRNGVIPVF